MVTAKPAVMPATGSAVARTVCLRPYENIVYSTRKVALATLGMAARANQAEGSGGRERLGETLRKSQPYFSHLLGSSDEDFLHNLAIADTQ